MFPRIVPFPLPRCFILDVYFGFSECPQECPLTSYLFEKRLAIHNFAREMALIPKIARAGKFRL